MQKERMDEIIGQIIMHLDGQANASHESLKDLHRETFFEFFADAYNAGQITPGTLRDTIYEKWIERRIHLLDQLTDAWEDWTLAWENSDKKS